MNLLPINLMIAFAWAAASGSFTTASAITGFVAGFAALSVFSAAGGGRYAGRVWGAIDLTFYFLYDLLRSSWGVALAVLNPERVRRAKFVTMPLDVQSELGISLTANLITLTPGTLTVDIAEDRSHLLIHAMFADDPDALIADTKAGLERRVMRITE